MPTFRLQCSFAADSAFPRDRMVMTPHFDVGSALVDAQALCDDLAAALHTWCAPTGTREISVKAYDAAGTPPVFPVGEAVVNPSQAPPTGCIREVALCLSFFAERNRPRQRGRLYVPLGLVNTGATVALRPTTANMNKVAELVPIFTGLGGADVDWCIWSDTDNVMRSVTDWWIDDEWDIIRSRGLRPTMRQSGTTSEG